MILLPWYRRYDRVDLLLIFLLIIGIGVLGVTIRCEVAAFMAVVVLLLRMCFPHGIRNIDLVLLAIVIFLVGLGEFFLHGSPEWWGWYVGLLDFRNWSPRTWFVMAVAWLAVLLLIYFWPRKRSVSNRTTG